MFKAYKQWRINRLLIELVQREAMFKRLDEGGYLAGTTCARIAFIKEKLRQLGHKEN